MDYNELEVSENCKVLREESRIACAKFIKTLPMDDMYCERVFAAMDYARCRAKELSQFVKELHGIK